MRFRPATYTTRACIVRFDKYLSRLGRILYVRAYRYQGKYGLNEAILVRGTKGSVRFLGLMWSYRGEGPRGTIQLLTKLGVQLERAELIAFTSERYQERGTDWLLHFTPNAEGKVVHQLFKKNAARVRSEV